MAEVWMDDYKKYFYLSRVELKGKEVGDLSKRKHLREELACHSFDWYLDNIIPHKYRMDRDSKLWGRLRSHKHPSLCIDHLQRDEAHKLKTYTLGKILIRLMGKFHTYMGRVMDAEGGVTPGGVGGKKGTSLVNPRKRKWYEGPKEPKWLEPKLDFSYTVAI